MTENVSKGRKTPTQQQILFIVWYSEEDRYPAYLAVCIYGNVLCKDAMG